MKYISYTPARNPLVSCIGISIDSTKSGSSAFKLYEIARLVLGFTKQSVKSSPVS